MRTIDADALKNAIDAAYVVFGECVYAKGIVDRQPTIDAVPVNDGRWKTKIIHGTYCFQCSACNSIYNGDTHYCPHCGALMDGGANDDN